MQNDLMFGVRVVAIEGDVVALQSVMVSMSENRIVWEGEHSVRLTVGEVVVGSPKEEEEGREGDNLEDF